MFSALVVLLAVHYTYNLAYNPQTQQVLEFLQEKLVGDRLPTSRKMSTTYANLFRAVDCLEQKFDDQDTYDGSEDYTQAFCDF